MATPEAMLVAAQIFVRDGKNAQRERQYGLRLGRSRRAVQLEFVRLPRSSGEKGCEFFALNRRLYYLVKESTARRRADLRKGS